MKDFIKWLGVNEKIAKVAVWLLIIMVTLIIVNTALASLGFPNYQITYDNLKVINTNEFMQGLINWIVIFLNFYATMLLIFRVKESKKLLKHGVIYLIINIAITEIFNKGIVQIFILIYFIAFAYFYSHKNRKYILYSVISLFINTIIQGCAYLYKVQLINFSELNTITKSLLSLDYFIIMAIIIIVKEIYLKKRSDRKCQKDKVGYGGDNSKKKEN